VAAALRRLADADDVAHIAVMPDVHLAEDVCIGTVVATREVLYPAAVGGDIGCGVAALRFAADAAVLDNPRTAALLLDELGRRVPALRHPVHAAPALPAALGPLSSPRLTALARQLGPLELGTLGRGNHFLELQADDAGALWLMVHSGSRALGQAIRDHHLRGATPRGGGLYGLDADSAAGVAYLGDLDWALTFADRNRRAIADAVIEILARRLGIAAELDTWCSCHHNHVRRELHEGAWRWVHRKGAIPAGRGEPGLIPGSMGTASYHVAGRGVAAALASSSHGAGRRFSRTEARRRISARAVARQLGAVWFDHRIADALRDEAPAAYKNVDAVIRAQAELTRVVRRVRPRLSYKGV
jgi:tRNA-splicing ligase RtcB (3'-phosphate/5'-hydroxy nucleic acid ligase)